MTFRPLEIDFSFALQSKTLGPFNRPFWRSPMFSVPKPKAGASIKPLKNCQQHRLPPSKEKDSEDAQVTGSSN